MTSSARYSRFRFIIGLLCCCEAFTAAHGAPTPPKVGTIAPNFKLHTIDGQAVELKAVVAESAAVIVVLRGWPGYQCPLCTLQVNDFVGQAARFAERKARVIMIYPGPAEQLRAHADEFLSNKRWPEEFVFLLDPDYQFTEAYGLRWHAKKETAYPATLTLERGGRIRFVQVSEGHGNRVPASRALAELP